MGADGEMQLLCNVQAAEIRALLFGICKASGFGSLDIL